MINFPTDYTDFHRFLTPSEFFHWGLVITVACNKIICVYLWDLWENWIIFPQITQNFTDYWLLRSFLQWDLMSTRPLLAAKNYLCISVRSVGEPRRKRAGWASIRSGRWFDNVEWWVMKLIPDGPSDYSGLHPADALSLVSDARRLGLL